MVCDPEGSEPINQYALVAYIPDPLGRYLDDLRRFLVPECIPHAHVTVLPPRALSYPSGEVWEEISGKLHAFSPFEVELTEVDVFGTTSVVYLQLNPESFQRFVEMHDVLNSGKAWFEEPYSYHPHSTLAQWITPEQLDGVYEQARIAWAQCRVPKRFTVDRLVFVQNTLQNRWIDLAEQRLGSVRVGAEGR